MSEQMMQAQVEQMAAAGFTREQIDQFFQAFYVAGDAFVAATPTPVDNVVWVGVKPGLQYILPKILDKLFPPAA